MVKKCPSCGYNNRDDASFCSSCGASLAGAAVPTLKPVPSVRVVTPVSPGGPIRVPPPGQCYYHPNLPAVYVCNRCGRSICRDDSKAYMDLVLCPQCYQGVVPMVAQQPPAPAYQPPAYQPPAYQPAPPPMAQAVPSRSPGWPRGHRRSAQAHENDDYGQRKRHSKNFDHLHSRLLGQHDI